MSKMLTALAAVAVTVVVALPVASNAAERRSDDGQSVTRADVSTTRQHQRRHVREGWAPGYAYGEPYAYAPNEAYDYYPYVVPNASATSHAAFGFGG